MNTHSFKDNFSKQSDLYVKHRPLYPVQLYAFLASLTGQHELAWDCGTGNGQAAVGLAGFYNSVIATDPSEQQIKNSLAHNNVKYLIEKAENNSIQTNSIDLLTVANALHWFDFNGFYKEVNRVLKSNGVIAAWCYGNPVISPGIDEMIKHFHDKVIYKYWPPESKLVEKEYSTVPFPFEKIEAPLFFYEKKMTLPDLIGYLNTWSATQHFIDENKFNPTENLYHELHNIWKNIDEEKTVTWKLILKVGRAGRS